MIFSSIITLLVVWSVWASPVNAARIIEPLQLSLNLPSAVTGEDCGHPPVAGSQSGSSNKRPRLVQESEHRPVPKRKYHFNDHRRRAGVKAFVRRPDGSVIEPELSLGVNPRVTFSTPRGDGPAHGANSVYVVEQGIEENTLLVRAAKWITMHHSCGWGHDNKFDDTRTNPQALETIPFEIIIDKLWDPNYHASVKSGDQLLVTVVSYGKPVPGAKVTLKTEKGWIKQMMTDENGTATLQLIRDYYPSSWQNFHRNYRANFLVTAEYEADLKGNYRDQPYNRISYITTLPWKYSPSRQDYSSYTFGLLIGALSLTVSSVGVYAYRERRKKPYKRISFDE